MFFDTDLYNENFLVYEKDKHATQIVTHMTKKGAVKKYRKFSYLLFMELDTFLQPISSAVICYIIFNIYNL